ncbi:hypothetical protein [Haliangium sp.]|uniref:hypothetical protein n=1 Tax=Haliangium sp. TaxID=2663208 RepID=UPI003D0FC321
MISASACSDKRRHAPDDDTPETAVASPQAPTTPPEPSTSAPSAPPRPAVERALSPLEDDSGAHTGTHRWSHAAGSAGIDAVRDVAMDADGNIAVSGYYADGIDFGDGEAVAAQTFDAYVIKYDPSGARSFTMHAGGPGEDVASAVAFDRDGALIVAGLFSERMVLGDKVLEATGSDDVFIAKFDREGALQWAYAIGGLDSDGAHDLAVDADGSVYLTGSFRASMTVAETTLTSKGNEDVFLLKMTPDGALDWGKSFGDLYRDSGQRVAVDGEGHVVLLVEFTDEVSFGGPALKSAGNRDLALIKLDADGGHLWSKRYGSPFNELGLGVAVDPAGNIAITGSFDNQIDFGGGTLRSKGESDVYVAKLGPDGAHLWSKRYGGAREDIGYGVATDRYGNVAITGWFWNELDFGGGPLRAAGQNKDVFLLKLSATGEHLWSRRFGDRDHDQGRGVAMSPAGDVALAGIFRYQLDLGGEALESVREPQDRAPPPDLFVALFGP